jgi:hypothetical protein
MDGVFAVWFFPGRVVRSVCAAKKHQPEAGEIMLWDYADAGLMLPKTKEVRRVRRCARIFRGVRESRGLYDFSGRMEAQKCEVGF